MNPHRFAHAVLRLWTRTAAVAILAAPAAFATWSIVAVNTRTGEVCVASATCLDGFDLQAFLPVIVPGKGAAAAQSFVDVTGQNRKRLWRGIHDGMEPAAILQQLALHDPQHQTRQYGIATLGGEPIGFTGLSAGHARYDFWLVDGDWRFSIQGNVLTGIQVVTNAAEVFMTTNGDLSQKAMAAMEAARVYGGDGRCSCNPNSPTSCGCPPASFTYSAFTAFIVVARIGDPEGTCGGPAGCANGRYYCDLRVISFQGGVEPVIALEERYAAWRLGLAGRADQVLSTVTKSAQSLPADGKSKLSVEVQLVNLEGVPVPGTNAVLSIAPAYAGASVGTIGEITSLGGGRYRFSVTATTTPGEGRWRITVAYPTAEVLLWPELVVRVDPLAELHCGFDIVSAAAGATVPLTINAGAANAGRPYRILASASGTVPGQEFLGVHMPLNRDALFLSSVTYAGTGNYPGTAGQLDLDGRAAGAYLATPALLLPHIGQRFDWAAILLGSPHHVTNGVAFDVGP